VVAIVLPVLPDNGPVTSTTVKTILTQYGFLSIPSRFSSLPSALPPFLPYLPLLIASSFVFFSPFFFLLLLLLLNLQNRQRETIGYLHNELQRQDILPAKCIYIFLIFVF
jgi:hypothetical protein